MATIEFKIEGKPPNTTAQGKRLNRATGQFFASKQHASDMEALRLAMRPYKPTSPLEGAVFVTIQATWPHTKATPKKLQAGTWPKTSKPDADNFFKGVIDCLVDEGFFLEDSKVYRLHVAKFVGPPELVGIQIIIKTEEQ